MTSIILASTVLTLLCAGPMAATAALPRTTSVSTKHALRIARRNFADIRAAVPDPLTVFPRAAATATRREAKRASIAAEMTFAFVSFEAARQERRRPGKAMLMAQSWRA
jgi:hypothetical protein